MVTRALGLYTDLIGVGPPILRSQYATSTSLSYQFALSTRDLIINNPVMEQQSTPVGTDVNELSLTNVGGNNLEGYSSFSRISVPYYKFKSSASGFALDLSQTFPAIFGNAAAFTAANTTIVGGGNICSALLTQQRLNVGYRIGKLDDPSCVKGQALTLTGGVFADSLPFLTAAGVATSPFQTWYAMHDAVADDLVGYASSVLVMTKVAAATIGIGTTTAGTLYKAAAAGTWATTGVDTAYAMRVEAEDTDAVMLTLQYTF